MIAHLFTCLLSIFCQQNVSSKGLFYLLLHPQGLHTACVLLTFADPIGVLSSTPILKEVCSSFKTHLKGYILKWMILSSSLLCKVQTHKVIEHLLQDRYVQGSRSETVNRICWQSLWQVLSNGILQTKVVSSSSELCGNGTIQLTW